MTSQTAPTSDLSWLGLVEALPHAAFVLDAGLSFLCVNAEAADLLGCAAEELVGRPSAIILPHRCQRLEGEPFFRHLASARQHDRPRWTPVRRRDGVEVMVAHMVAKPIDGRILVSLRRRDETVPADGAPSEGAAEETLRRIFENAPIAIFYFDADGVITASNDSFVRLLGSTRSKVVGLSMTTLPDPRIRACVKQALGGETSHFSGDYRSATSGRLVPTHGIFAPCRGVDDTIVGGIGIFEDETDRRSIQRALSRSERMAALGTLAGGVAHELNTPIAYVMASLELARQRVGELDMTTGGLRRELVEALDNAFEGSRRVRDLVRDIRAFVREDPDATARSLALEAVIETAIQLTPIRDRAGPDTVEVVRAYQPVPAVFAVESKLVQVFVNLLVNACQSFESSVEGAAPGQGRITVATRLGNDGCVIAEVRDEGRGIATEDLEHVFEPFWTRRPLGQGPGLGLSICHGIVSSLGGKIEVESEVGCGTLVRISLPPAQEASRRAEPSGVHLAPTIPARILIIEDEPRLATSLKLALEPDHRVVVVTDGQSALDLLEVDSSFDMILSDLMMPGLTGRDVYGRARDIAPDIVDRFVFMTGGAFTPRMQDFLASVDNPRLDKPFEIGDVEEVLRRVRTIAPRRDAGHERP